MARKYGLINLDRGEILCANCKHFHQHYIAMTPKHVYPIHVGHCSFPRMKDRMVTDACERFEHGERAEYAQDRDKREAFEKRGKNYEI